MGFLSCMRLLAYFGVLVAPALVTATTQDDSHTTTNDQCDASNFPVNVSNIQAMNLQEAAGAHSATECVQACCASQGCVVWQFSVGGAASPLHSCWIGKHVRYGGFQQGWLGGAVAGSPKPPTPPPPPPAGPYPVDDRPAGLGLRWEGVGAISGGGATTKLLMDYDPSVASDILDYLFKPNFGLSLQMLKVEIGGDSDATEGAEPSHMHYRGDENYNRGYEWWLMKEAKARNPDIQLYGLPWAWPGWLDPTAGPDKPAKNAFADANITANYTLAWLLAAKRVHGLDIDWVGQWNERNAPGDYASALRTAVANSGLRTTVLNRLPHYPGTSVEPDPNGCKDKTWNTTDGEYWVDEEGSVADGRSARCLARCVSRNYVTGCHTATFQWHLVSSFYDYLPWARCGVAVANTPWSGSYEVTSPTWALAHTTQFAPVGWRYAAHDYGVGLLSGGGSYVTRISPDKKDFSIVVEKMSHDKSVCARGNNPAYETKDEEVVLVLQGAFLEAAGSSLRLWYSNLTEGNGSEQLFVKKTDVPVQSGGRVSIMVHPEEIYTLTTLTTGGKGNHTVPPASPLSLPYHQDFDSEVAPAPARLWYDQMGAFEIAPKSGDDTGSNNSGGSRGGDNVDNVDNVMRQVVPVWPDCWGYSCSGPKTYFGPAIFQDNVTVSIDAYLETDAALSFGLHGKTAMLNSTTGAATFGSCSVNNNVAFGAKMWHTVAVSYGTHGGAPDTLTLNGKVVCTSPAGKPGGNQAVDLGLSRYIFAEFDNFNIKNN